MPQSETSAPSETGGATTTNTYQLTCTDCSFETTVEGDYTEAFEAAEAHQDGHGATAADHFVNFAVQ